MAQLNQDTYTFKGNTGTIRIPIDDVPSVEDYNPRFGIVAVDPQTVPDATAIPKIIDKTSEIDIIGNEVFIPLNKEDTDLLSGVESGDYWFMLELVNNDGDGGIVSSGKFKLYRSIFDR